MIFLKLATFTNLIPFFLMVVMVFLLLFDFECLGYP